MLRTPPDILITTPESLFLLLTSQARETLRGVETVILDEVHVQPFGQTGKHDLAEMVRPIVAVLAPIFFASPEEFRRFMHADVRYHTDSGIKKPEDLKGKRLGVPEYQMTAPVWIRGMLQDEFGVPVESVTYVTGGEEEPGRDEKIKLALPASIRVEPIGPTQTLSSMLALAKPWP